MHPLPALWVLCLAAAAAAQPVRMTLLSAGAMPKIGYYSPLRLVLSDQPPPSVGALPKELAAPLFGVIEIAGQEGAVYHVVVDEPVGGPSRLYADSNGNGDLTDDPVTEWAAREYPGEAGAALTMHMGGATLNLGTAEERYDVRLGMYRFDAADPRRADLKDALLYYRDYAPEGEVTLAGRAIKAMLNDEQVSGDFRGADVPPEAPDADSGVALMLDANGNGKFDTRGERFDVRRPFNIGGVTYEIAGLTRDGRSFEVVRSEKTVAEIPPPPDHSVGKPITAFEATTMDGKTVRFPQDYKGKVVMLDFWATWCGPCMAEVPHVVAAYQKFHGKGYEILGVSLDDEGEDEAIRKVLSEKKMTWPQVYDGGGWKARVADVYAIDSIPAVFLVDGDTGRVIADQSHLRGEALEKTVEEELAKKARGG